MSDLFEFEATHGVHLADLDVQFARDEATKERVVYRYATDNSKKAAALAKVEDYGIKLVSKPEKPAKAPAQDEQPPAPSAPPAE